MYSMIYYACSYNAVISASTAVQLLYHACKRFISLYTCVNNLSINSLHRTHIISLAIIPGLERTIDGIRPAPLSMNELTMNGILARFGIRL